MEVITTNGLDPVHIAATGTGEENDPYVLQVSTNGGAILDQENYAFSPFMPSQVTNPIKAILEA